MLPVSFCNSAFPFPAIHSFQPMTSGVPHLYQFEIPQHFIDQNPKLGFKLECLLALARKYKPVLSSEHAQALDWYCERIFQTHQYDEPHLLIEYGALLYLLDHDLFQPICIGEEFKDRVAHLLYTGSLEIRHKHKMIMGREHKSLISGHERVLIEQLSHIFYLSDGSFNPAAIETVRFLLTSTRLQKMFKPEHLEHMQLVLKALEKQEEQFAQLASEVVHIHKEMEYYLRLSQAKSQKADLTSADLYLEVIRYLLQFEFQSSDVKNCYVHAPVRYLKQMNPIVLAKFVVGCYQNGYFSWGREDLEISHLIENELDHTIKRAYATVGNAAQLPIVEHLKMHLEDEPILSYGNSVAQVLQSDYAKNVFWAQIHNPTALMVQTLLQIPGINGLPDNPTPLKRSLSTLFREAMVDLGCSSLEINRMREVLNKYLFFLDLSPAEIFRSSESISIVRGTSLREIKSNPESFEPIIQIFRWERGLFFCHKGLSFHIQTLNDFKNSICEVFPKCPLLRKENEHLLTSLFQQYILEDLKKQDVVLSKKMIGAEIVFMQSGAFAGKVLEYLNISKYGIIYFEESKSSPLEGFSMHFRSGAGPTSLLSRAVHICTAHLQQTPEEISAIHKQIVSQGDKILTKTCLRKIRQVLHNSFGRSWFRHFKTLSKELSTVTFKDVKDFCLAKGVHKERLAQIVQQAFERLELNQSQIWDLCRRLFPALTWDRMAEMAMQIEGFLALKPQDARRLAHKIRKLAIDLGFQNVQINEIEKHIRLIANLPLHYRFANTNWEALGQPVSWTFGYDYIEERLAVFKETKHTCVLA